MIIVGGAVAAWATVSAGSTGYRTASVTRADIGTNLTVVGNVEPVNDVAPSFQVGGQVATVTVAPGQAVTAGQTLATLDTTALGETVSSDQSALNADQAKLVEDEENESTASSASSAASRRAAHVQDDDAFEHDDDHRPLQQCDRLERHHHPGPDDVDPGRGDARTRTSRKRRRI